MSVTLQALHARKGFLEGGAESAARGGSLPMSVSMGRSETLLLGGGVGETSAMSTVVD